MNRRLLWTLTVLGGSFAGGLAANLLLDVRATAHAQPASPLPPPPSPIDRPNIFVPERFDQVIRQIAPAVVAVDAVKPATPGSAKAKSKSEEESGSGVVVRLDGFRGRFAVTNNHVVGGSRPADITVTLADGRILVPERVWVDPESDVAVLKLPADDLPTAELGDSDRVKVGHWVLAFGSPFGLNQTVTHGIISARDRGQISLGNTIRIKEFLQTDAAINPGSSGGPLVDMTGAVVGINTAIASNNGNNSGVSFSIPSNLVRRVARELLEKGIVSRGYLGIQLSPTLEPATALRLGLSRVWGALVESVHPGGPAALGGVRPGDVVLKLDAVEVRDENHLINLIGSLPVGQRVRVTVWRDRQPRALEVTVADWSTSVGRNR
jgi:S1-C subfamily serine protease